MAGCGPECLVLKHKIHTDFVVTSANIFLKESSLSAALVSKGKVQFDIRQFILNAHLHMVKT